MTIQLPEILEGPILAAVRSGRYASLDDAMAEAALLLVQRLKQEQSQEEQPSASRTEPVPKHKPVWEEFAEIVASISNEEWAKVPAAGAKQHDHNIYGTPKRPPTQ